MRMYYLLAYMLPVDCSRSSHNQSTTVYPSIAHYYWRQVASCSLYKANKSSNTRVMFSKRMLST